MQKQLAAVFVWGLSSFALGTLIGFAAQRTENVPELPDEKVDCCAMEVKPQVRQQIYFMEPHDIREANLPAYYKGDRYLLFMTAEKDRVFFFDLSLPVYDSEREDKALRKSKQEQERSK